MQYIMETIIIDLIKAKRPPHPMKKAIEWWHDATEDWTDEDWLTDRDRYFSSFYFSLPGRDKQKKVRQFIHDNNVRIMTGGYSNKEVDKLRIKHNQDIKRMDARLKELNIDKRNCSINLPAAYYDPHFITRIYYKGKEIIY